MKNSIVQQTNQVRMLNPDELRSISGGSLVSYLLKFASWGASYFFHMGVQEGRKMRALL